MLTLFYGTGTCALAPLIALYEAEMAFELRRIDMKSSEQRSADYLKINPKGRVPALVTEKGILTENPALLVYIAQSAPEKQLAPFSDPFAFARLQSFNSYLCSTVHVAHAHGLRGARWADETASWEDMKRRVPGNVRDCFALIEEEMFQGPWVMGERYSVADPYLFTLERWMKGDGVEISDFPKIEAHYKRMMERPAVASAVAIEEA